VITTKFDYKFFKKAQVEKVERAKAIEAQAEKAKGKHKAQVEDKWVPHPSPPINSGVIKRVKLGPQDEGPSKRQRVELVLIATSIVVIATSLSYR